MQRNVSSAMTAGIHSRTEIVLDIAVARGPAITAEELTIAQDGVPVDPEVLHGVHGEVMHRFWADPGSATIEYSARIDGESPPRPVDPLDLVFYRRPSRYVESDLVGAGKFAGLRGLSLALAIGNWVYDYLSYVPGASGPTDGAVRTLALRRGVCRDYAHVTAALLRANDIPARYVSVYAPGLVPMDFHAVVEAHVDGAWHLIDSTRLAPPETMIPIAVGRDAADVAFMTNHVGRLSLTAISVDASVEPALDPPTPDARTDPAPVASAGSERQPGEPVGDREKG